MTAETEKIHRFAPAVPAVAAYAVSAFGRPLIAPTELAALNHVPSFLGDSVFAARVIPVAATLLSALAIYGFGRLCSSKSGFYAALIYLGSFAVFAAGTTATGLPSAMLFFWLLILGGMAAFLFDGRKRLAGLAGLVAGAAGLPFFSGALRSGEWANVPPEVLIITGLLPFLPFFSLWFSVWRKAPFRSEPMLQAAVVAAAFSVAAASVLPAAGVLGGAGALALAGGRACERYFAENPDGERFGRNLRSAMMMIAAGVLLVLLLPFAVRPREYYYVPAVAGIIWLVWTGYGRTSRNPAWKFGGFALGIVFVFVMLSWAPPRRFVASHDFSAPFKAYNITRLTPPPAVFTEPELLGFVRRQLSDYRVSPLDESFRPGGGPVLVISRLGEKTAGLPAADRRTVYKPSNLVFTEYGI